MRKLIIIWIFCSVALFSKAKNGELEIYRSYMSAASQDKNEAKKFYQSTRNFDKNTTPIMMGYKAIAQLMMCKYVANPLTKLSYFNKGKALLEQAIAKDSENPELIFMRFCTQNNAPKMLGYHQNLSDDKKVLLRFLEKKSQRKNRDDDLFKRVKSFLIQQNICTEKEKNILENIS